MIVDISILNLDFIRTVSIGVYTSFLWTERYLGYGDFELYVPANSPIMQEIQLDRYVSIRGSDALMIIEEIDTKSDAESGAYSSITGRSLESILTRRVITTKTTLSGNFQDAIEKLLNDNIISPSESKRKIENFVFKRSEAEDIMSLTIDPEVEYLGENLYDIILELCTEKKVGFRVIWVNDKFEFSLYTGKDHSWDQEENGVVVFSPSYENLISSDYFQSKKEMKTSITLIKKDNESTTIVTVDSEEEGYEGLFRRETSLETSEDDLEGTGKIELSSLVESKLFDGEISTNSSQFEFRKDYDIGDIVEFENEYGHTGKVRIMELIVSSDDSQMSLYPTFESV